MAAHHPKVNKQANKQERKVCFISDARNWGQGHVCPKANSPRDNQQARVFIDRQRGLHAESVQSALTVIFKLVMDGLTRVILVVLGAVNLQFQGQFVSISLRPILGIVAAYVMGFPGGASGKEPACQCRGLKRHGFSPWVGKIPWRRDGNQLQYSCLGNSMDRAAVHGVTKSRMQLK